MEAVGYKIENNIIYTPDLKMPDSRGVGYIYYNNMLSKSTEIAQIDGLTKATDTFGSLLQRCVRVAMSMTKRGIKPGDFISISSTNHLNSCVPHIASYFVGAVMAAIDPMCNEAEALFLLRKVKPKIIFVSSKEVNTIEKAVKGLETDVEIVVFGESDCHTPYSDFLEAQAEEQDFKPYQCKDLNELALVIFSSGTTGMPKGICFNHLNCLSFVLEEVVMPKLTLYSVCSPYWSVFTVLLHINIMWGMIRIVYPQFDSNDPWQVYKQKVDIAFLNVPQATTLIRTKMPEDVDLKNVKVLWVGGMILSVERKLEIMNALPHTLILGLYGQTECIQGLLSYPLNAKYAKLSMLNHKSSGTINRGISYKIVDPETEEILGPNQVGELRVKTKGQCMGYYKEDSTGCFDSYGWLKTGDLFYYDENLLFCPVDRIKESFKFNGIHILPCDIENVIECHECVDKAVVLGISNEIDCNHPIALVSLKENSRNVTEDEIIKYVEDRVEDKNRLRGGVKFVKSFPKTVTEKVKRYMLKRMLQNGEI